MTENSETPKGELGRVDTLSARSRFLWGRGVNRGVGIRASSRAKDRREGGSIHRFSYPWWQRLLWRAPQYGWRVNCGRCTWLAEQPEHKRGLHGAYRRHVEAEHGG